MFDHLFEKDAQGTLKGMTLEWVCPRCSGKNFRILPVDERGTGMHHDRCRYCRVRFRVTFLPHPGPLGGEAEFVDRLADEHFTEEEQKELVRDFAEIEYMRAENANPREVTGKQRLLEEKIVFFKRRSRI